jgi:hypothetical protein
VAGEQNQLEAVLNFVNAVFNGDTGHCLSFAVVISGLRIAIQLKAGEFKFFVKIPLPPHKASILKENAEFPPIVAWNIPIRALNLSYMNSS